MARYTYQILADFLNRIEDHRTVSQAFSTILSEDVVLYFGTSEYIGKNAVIEFLENSSKAMASEYGFDAVPVIIYDTEDASLNFTKDRRHSALALYSKLEDYISWFLIVRCDQNFLINRIYSTRGQGYSIYKDYYVKGNYNYPAQAT